MSEPLASGAIGLTRDSRSDEIHDSTPLRAVEAEQVVPDRRRSQGTVRHSTGQRRGGKGFPLHETDGAVAFQIVAQPLNRLVRGLAATDHRRLIAVAEGRGHHHPLVELVEVLDDHHRHLHV